MKKMNTWISGVTSLASMLSAWMNARTAGLDYGQANSAAIQAQSVGGNQAELTSLNVVSIHESLLGAYVNDIENAERRFVDAIRNSKNGPTELDFAARAAQNSVRLHLRKVLDHSDGRFPSPELEQFWSSCMCNEVQGMPWESG